jgi:hypothetical protein
VDLGPVDPGPQEPGSQEPAPRGPLLLRRLRMQSLQGRCHQFSTRTHLNHQIQHLCCIVLRDPCPLLHSKFGT